MKRVLQLPDSIEKRNGRMSVIMNVYRQIDRTKIQFDFIAIDYGKENFADEIKKLGGNIYLLPSNKASLSNISSFFNKVINLHHYDYIHYHAISKWGICLNIAHRKRIKVIVHSHSAGLSDSVLKSIRNRIFSLNIIPFSNKRAAVSPEAGKKLFMWQSFEYLPNAIDYNQFAYSELNRQKIRIKYHIGKSTLLIGMVGRIVKVKNQLFAIKVLNSLINQKLDFKLMLVGDFSSGNRDYYQKVISLIKKYKLEPYVIITGMLQNVNEYYSAFDLLWLPSLYEGMPTVGIEAQANGLPILVSKHVSSVLKIADNVHFLPINKQSVSEWFYKTIKMKKSRNQYALAQFNNSKFNITQVLNQWYSLYR